MTFKKSNKPKLGQSIFEYFILTTAVVAVVLFFTGSQYFINIRNSLQNAFTQGVEQILR